MKTLNSGRWFIRYRLKTIIILVKKICFYVCGCGDAAPTENQDPHGWSCCLVVCTWYNMSCKFILQIFCHENVNHDIRIAKDDFRNYFILYYHQTIFKPLSVSPSVRSFVRTESPVGLSPPKEIERHPP